MITVRFSNGQAVTYNSAQKIMPYEGGFKILNSQDGLMAVAPSGSLIEWTQPCKVENPISNATLHAAIEKVLDEAHRATDWSTLTKLADLKRLLRNFSMQQCRWLR